jgi:hypothetical protein
MCTFLSHLLSLLAPSGANTELLASNTKSLIHNPCRSPRLEYQQKDINKSNHEKISNQDARRIKNFSFLTADSKIAFKTTPRACLGGNSSNTDRCAVTCLFNAIPRLVCSPRYRCVSLHATPVTFSANQRSAQFQRPGLNATLGLFAR